jgi:hypothetical protein
MFATRAVGGFRARRGDHRDQRPTQGRAVFTSQVNLGKSMLSMSSR